MSEGRTIQTTTTEDQHHKVAILFQLAEDDKTHIAVSVNWILANGYPMHPATGEAMIYRGTYIIQ